MIRWLIMALGVFVLGEVVFTELTMQWQIVFAAACFLASLVVRRNASKQATIFLILLSMVVSSRYIFWRLTQTVFTEEPVSFVFSMGLFLAELYAWLIMVLGYFQTIWPLHRKPVELPKDIASWPTVDIFIPTYNEPLSVVRSTMLACLAIDWPQDKVNIYLLDDGRREEFRKFADTIGIHYMVRPDNLHAKAGNINHALQQTQGEYVVIFDSDHVPARSFLQVTMGWFLRDPKLGMLQTPHHFYSPDPFERNLDTFKTIPNEGKLFYGLVQDGNDFWNATFFCGSCAVLRRSILEEVGGVAVETVTEDAHTALKMQRHGYNTAYLKIPQAGGLATESLSAHVGQRIRWARGMAQIFRVDNPLRGRGLTLAQRLCYTNAMLHFFYGLPRLIFLTAPLAYLYFQLHTIQASALMILVYALPHLVHANLTNSRMQRDYRHTFWAEVYETSLASYILLPTLVALINPKSGKFNVTAKGGLVEAGYFDQKIAKPYLVLLLLNLIGFSVGVGRLLWWNAYEMDTVILNMAWTLYNMIVLGATLAVAWERRQLRTHPRIDARLKAMLKFDNGRTIACETENFSEGGVALKLPAVPEFKQDQPCAVSLFRGEQEYVFPAKCIGLEGNVLRVRLHKQTIQQEHDWIQCTLSRADLWTGWEEGQASDRPLLGMTEIIRHGLRGLSHVVGYVLGRAKARQQTDTAPAKLKGSNLTLLALGGALVYLLVHSIPSHAASQPSSSAGRSDTYTLQQLGAVMPAQLTAAQGSPNYYFSLRSDEVVTSANLKLKYGAYTKGSQNPMYLDIRINAEPIAKVPLTVAGAADNERTIAINPLLLTGSNTLTFNLVNADGTPCAVGSNGERVTISNQSALLITGQPLPLQADLRHLPAPFFDPRDMATLQLPFILPAHPPREMLRAAGIVASWFGSLAGYRGAFFPANIDETPSSNAVVFAMPGQSPAKLAMPQIMGPTLAVSQNPANPATQLLWVMGRNEGELLIAAQALSLGQVPSQGQHTLITAFHVPEKKHLYDAPNWLPIGRKVRFSELAAPPGLQRNGMENVQIPVNFRLPPDLFELHSTGVPMELAYRYQPQYGAAQAKLDISLNHHFIRSLQPFQKGWLQQVAWLHMPAFPFGHVDGLQKILLPLDTLSGRNQLLFDFSSGAAAPACPQGTSLARALINANSTLDFTHLTHFTLLPNLAYFVNDGFPFTRRPDLADSVIVLPDAPSRSELEAFFQLMGRFGESTGYPALYMTVASSGQIGAFPDKDILVIGSMADQPLLEKWAKYMPINPLTGQRQQSWRNRIMAGLHVLIGDDVLLAGPIAGTTDSVSDATQMTAFESPLKAHHSVVMVFSRQPEGLRYLRQPLLDSNLIQKVQGDWVAIQGQHIQAAALGAHYEVGTLPWMTWWRWKLSTDPLLLTLVSLFALTVVTILLYADLRKRAQKRMQ